MNFSIYKNKNGKDSNHKWPLLFLTVLVLVFTSGCQNQPSEQQVTLSGPVMGTEYRISALVLPDTDLGVLEQKLLAAMELVNQSMSTYIPDSELSRFNQAKAGEVIALSPAFAEVLASALSVSELSDGAFDVTLAGVIKQWGFGVDGRVSEQPSGQALEALRQAVGYKKLTLNLEKRTLSKSVDNVAIDLSAIAKGYAVDKVADALLDLGIQRFLINIGGELRAAGTKLDNTPWQVGIEKPHALGGIQQIVSLQDQAIATSGDYRNYYLIDDQPFSHTIDAKTLKPVFHQLALVSVIADSAMLADALATAMLAMGEKRAYEFANVHDLAVYMIIRDSSGDEPNKVLITDKFKPYLQ